MKQVAPHDRPREKLVLKGAAALGDNEIVALVLGTGTRARGALQVAQDALTATGGVRGLGRADVADLQRVPGIGASRAARLLAAVELGRRAMRGDPAGRPVIDSATKAAEYLLPLHGGYAVERIGVLLLDARCQVMRTDIVSVGTVDASIMHPREIFRPAIAAAAASIIVFHNHPSGDPAPSPADRVLTRRLQAAGEIVGIEVVDHLILGDGCWFSFRDKGGL